MVPAPLSGARRWEPDESDSSPPGGIDIKQTILYITYMYLYVSSTYIIYHITHTTHIYM